MKQECLPLGGGGIEPRVSALETKTARMIDPNVYTMDYASTSLRPYNYANDKILIQFAVANNTLYVETWDQNAQHQLYYVPLTPV